MNDLVSVIMPSYNTAKYIGESIDSVINQTYKNWELIIVDDFSNDGSDKIIESFSDNRIRCIKNDVNIGAALSRNKALEEAKGRWIAFLDSDDIWDKSKLEKQINFMEKHNYSFTYTNYEEINIYGQKTGVKVSGPKNITLNGMRRYCWLGCLTVMYDANKIGLIHVSDIKKNNDYAMWLRVSEKANCHLCDDYLAYYRRGRTGSISTDKIRNLIIWHYRLHRIDQQQGIWISIYRTIRNMMYGCYKKIKYVKK